MLPHDSNYTSQLKSLISRVSGRSIVKDSMVDCAVVFFESQATLKKETSTLKHEQDALNNKLIAKSTQKKAKVEKSTIEGRLDEVEALLIESKKTRHKNLAQICEQILFMTEGDNLEETNRKSAQFLGAIQLISPTEGRQVAHVNERHKSLYKAVLCLRLLDALCLKQLMNDPYVSEYLSELSVKNYNNFAQYNPVAYQAFCRWVKTPIIMAALLQDIGNFHPAAQAILVGEDNQLDPHRTLEVEDRKRLLQINFRETLTYLAEGVGVATYTGNSRKERDDFVAKERKKMAFVKLLLKSSIQPKNGIGNLLKVPQIYTSIILSTKKSYNYKVLPNVYTALYQNVERGHCNRIMVDCLYEITGIFPQGYGITYVPLESDGQPSDCYEYAIVNRLYPPDPEQPLCRMATRKLTYISYGHNIVVEKHRNLFFPQSTKILTNLSKARLNEILELLASNYAERQQLDLLPRCWHTKDYFSLKNHQKLWTIDEH